MVDELRGDAVSIETDPPLGMPIATENGAETAGGYSALWRIPGVPALVISMLLSRLVLDGMLIVALVLTCLKLYGSAPFAGLVVFLATVPGLVLTPAAGALLDRRGRVAFMRLDAVVAAAALGADALGIATNHGPPALLATTAVVLSLTRPLAQAGGRALVPTMIPAHLWDRANAVDSALFTITGLCGPLLATTVFAFFGPAWTLATAAVLLVCTVVALQRVHETGPRVEHRASFWTEARKGIAYYVGNRALVVVGLVAALQNIVPGTINVALPTIVVTRLGEPTWVVGCLLVLSQIGSLITLTITARRGTDGMEARVMAVGALTMGLGAAAMVAQQNLVTLAIGMLAIGAGVGPFWVGVYGLRQRRTDPRFYSRAFALSFASSFIGQPIGALVAGQLVGAGAVSLALGVAVVCAVLAAVMTRFIPVAQSQP